MNHLMKPEKNKAVTAYEDIQELSARGDRTIIRRYYSSQPAPEKIEVKNPKPANIKKDEDLDTISFMVLLNSVCLFFLLILTFVKVLIG